MPKTTLITGGAGFIGTNAAAYYLKKGNKVVVYDNLSRAGAKQNLNWLKKQGGNLVFVKGDIRDDKKLLETFKKYGPDLVLHLAAQVTMVTSVENPREDFEINALGTFNLLEAMRNTKSKAAALYSSTNKVMGELLHIPVLEKEKRYDYKNIKGVNESFPLDFFGPYGCSKGTGDQYFLDYARIFGLNTIVFRQSGIYGSHQFGIEEQGWLAWFCNALLFDKPVTIFGNGKQVRDVLYIDDLLRAFDLALKNIKKTRGKAYNVGGGPKFSLSIWELFEILEKLAGKKFNYKFGPWRPGDQKVYISDVSKAKKDFGWSPTISPKEGVKNLYNWIFQNKNLIKKAGVFKK
ncbi:MAG: CDP-paratose 2-epimerase [Candidatus Nealsonbacteria bacterium CG23_combo_of_CG06-09_8_20_14_all_37_18]|uniref:CDP-paratose 2-epimerase n=1 Tax=Candidatus Nealsonbacteria bacterium CG23_combo_of_CG06-09_8_20_14_all_37_18 TaxID=1974720 RepID=A0A2G9YZJ2_9BACT|nr:MAG: CDP-paratose 2-epimerase [Candidatus Nealsonbacteria bacterium CG23_combo_of_CG06-09_8_20_14_all_37_18]